jgi:glutamyl-tRNA reductase
MKLFVVGFNHRAAPLGLREKFFVPENALGEMIEKFRRHKGLDEVVILNTCNRVEVYGTVSAFTGTPERFFSVLASEGNVPFEELQSCLYFHEDQECVRHLFRVASGLDSMVLGETEIIGQVKKAYQACATHKGTGRVLNQLFQKAFSVAKKIRSTSGLGMGSTSIGSVVVDLATQIFGEKLASQKVVVLGAGKMGETTLKHLVKNGVQSISVLNRSFEKSRLLADQIGAEAVDWNELPKALAVADIVVSSTSSGSILISQEELSRILASRPRRHIFLIDLAVPRNIDPRVQDLPQVTLFDIDQLGAVARGNMERRQTEAASLEGEVVRYSQEFHSHLVPRVKISRTHLSPSQDLMLPCPLH